ncbi:hypothetical protein V5735_19070 [Haladaptatus sp. SPP-AMP-3]|uniref:hypothetical protein n=1 Tax=Haladaptatus sp. SPP-AMP-3 TaxID=3121295 RepID=UPI003C2ACFB9
MNDSEVHSLILDRLEEVEDDDLQRFLTTILRHERKILDEHRAKYKDEYKSLVEDYIEDESIEEFDDG